MNYNKTGKVLTVAVAAVILLSAIYIMANGLGLQEGLDFGAGAYFYADIPDFEKYTERTDYQAKLPYWVYVLLFLVWGALMYWLWKWIDKK